MASNHETPEAVKLAEERDVNVRYPVSSSGRLQR